MQKVELFIAEADNGLLATVSIRRDGNETDGEFLYLYHNLNELIRDIKRLYSKYYKSRAKKQDAKDSYTVAEEV